MVAFELLDRHASLFGTSAITAAIAVTLLIRFRTRQRFAGPQDIHLEPTSRLGGIAVFFGYVLGLAVARELGLLPVGPALALLIAALPVQIVGVCEDIAHRVSPRRRLLAALVSATLAIAFADGVVTRLDLPYFDRWLSEALIAVPLTWFMVAGACNAFNIIDGNHGLAGGTALLSFLGLAIAAWNANDTLVLAQAVGITGALAGFLLWNYPRGKIFLGDAGAYFIGFMYAELSIQLIARNAGISAWFVIALAAYPIAETVFSIYRRKFVRHTAAMQPDDLHLHSLVYVCFISFAQRPRSGDRRCHVVAKAYAGGERRRPMRQANARVAPLLWLHAGLCFVSALYFRDNTPALIAFTCVYATLYIVCYRGVVRLNSHKVLLLPVPSAQVSAVPQPTVAQFPANLSGD